jgi:hypothetical protein
MGILEKVYISNIREFGADLDWMGNAGILLLWFIALENLSQKSRKFKA